MSKINNNEVVGSIQRDRMIIKAVPYISIASAFAGLILMLMSHTKELGDMLLRLCAPFVVGYALLGIYAYIKRDKGSLREWTTLAILLIAPAIISALLIIVTPYVMPDIIDVLIRVTEDHLDKNVSVFLAIYFLTALMAFTSHGVIATVVAYFKKYTARIYLSIEKIKNDKTDTRKNKISRRMFMIPDIIDIQCVELEPVEYGKKFPTRMFLSMAFSIFALGLAISSYIFLNPIFQSAMTVDEAVIVTVILTFFVPVLIIPWFIVRDTGAKIKSQARDYYLWKGLKRRLYQGFFAIMILLSMLAISLYFGYDIERTAFTYAGYVFITAFLSLMCAFIYANYYHSGFKEWIIHDFSEAKKK